MDESKEDDDNDLFAAEDEAMDEDEVLPQSLPLQVTQSLQRSVGQHAILASTSSAHAQSPGPPTLLDRIIVPSPFAQHNTGTSRFRTAFARILADPVNDTEAWLAVITETTSCYATIVDLAGPDSYAKLDWVESCYGALLYRFPYAIHHIVGVADILRQQLVALARSASPLHHSHTTGRTRQCRAKLALLFQTHLGIVSVESSETTETAMDATTDATMETPSTIDAPTSTSTSTPHSTSFQPLVLCTWVVELWLVYIQYVSHEASVTHATDARAVRDAVTAAYDQATAAAGDAHNNHVLWAAYRDFVQSWTLATTHPVDTTTSANVDHALVSKQMQQLRSVYQRMIVQPMPGLDAVWAEYEAFEKQQSEALAAALIQELAPKYQHARTVYLERSRVWGDAQLGRLATPPVAPSTPVRGTEQAHADTSDYPTKRLDEYHLLRVWKIRCSYERTNPGRLATTELQRRIRHTFCEMACTLTRHAEPWHMWSTWELLVPGGAGGTGTAAVASAPVDTSASSTMNGLDQSHPAWSASTLKAMQVLQLGQKHIPDATLLAHAEAQIVEAHHPAASVAVLNAFLERSPNTLGFILYQQVVRRHEGKDKARAVFARARKTLTNPETVKKPADVVATETGEADAENTERQATKKELDNGKRWIVTNRLDESIGATVTSAATVPEAGGATKSSRDNVAGPMTWHLYAAQAVMEHRINREPEVAARVYELGLRKHASFLTIPPYIQRYAQLLLELGDMVNLRALLTRAVAACDAEDKRDALASLWDMMLYFESMGGNADPASVAALQAIEQKRREALLGPDVEDVATGGVVGAGDVALIGAQKSSIAEQLIRSEGYDTSSRIVNGMKRLVDVLAVNGHWGTGDFEITSRRAQGMSSIEHDAQFSGGKSDASYQMRLQFEQLMQSGISPESAAMDGVAAAGSKMLTARERLAGASGVASGPAAGGTAILLAIQQSADWLRPLLLLLPASQLRLPIVAKPPPHLTEMALSVLRLNALPAERPADGVPKKGAKRSISANNDGSSDEEDGGGTSGYGAAFRSRQRARMEQNGTTHLN